MDYIQTRNKNLFWKGIEINALKSRFQDHWSNTTKQLNIGLTLKYDIMQQVWGMHSK